jgi:hypothetical protein
MTKLFIPVAALYAAIIGVVIKFFFENLLPPVVFPVIVGAVAGELTGGFEEGSKAGLGAGIMLSSVFIASAYSSVLMSSDYLDTALTISSGFALVILVEFAILGFVAGYLGGTVRDYIIPYT